LVAGFETYTALVLRIQSWFVRPSDEVIDVRRFGGTFRLHVLN